MNYLQIAVKKDPESVSAHIALARTYDLLQEKDKAERIYLDLIKKAPKNWEVHQGYGYFLVSYGRHKEAINHFFRVLELTPDNIVAINNVGASHLFLGEFKQAITYFKSALNLSPSSAAFSNLGTAYYYLGIFDKAAFYYRKAIDLSPLEMTNLNNIADAYHFIDQKEDVANDFRRRVKSYAEKEIADNPLNVLGYLHFAMASTHFGQLAEAKASLFKANEIDPNYYFSSYVGLRIAVAEMDYDQIISEVKKLKSSGYSDRLILSDPYFKVLVSDDYLYGVLKTEVNLNK